MIKLKDIIKESKVSYLTEAFKSKLLRKFSMKFRRLSLELLSPVIHSITSYFDK